MTRAAIYCRISKDREGRRAGVERQEADCRELCTDRGFNIVEPAYVDNDITAADPKKDRPAYRRLMADLKAGKADLVVVYDADRLHRQPSEVDEFVRDYLNASLSEVWTDSHGSYNLTDPNGLYEFRNAGALAERESGKMQRRIKRKKLADAQAGLPSGGPRAFGYEPGNLVIRESEAVWIRAAVAHVLSGGSIGSIRENWRANVETPSQERSRLKGQGTPHEWSNQVVRKILMSERIAGLRKHQGVVIGDAAWPSIISREDHEQVCAIMNDPSRKPKPASHNYPLRGILRCANKDCKGKLLAASPTSKDGKSIPHYGCRKVTGGCGLMVSARGIERYIFSVVLPLADSPAMRDVIANVEAGQDEQLRKIVADNAADETALAQLDEDYDDGVIDRARWIKRTQRLRERIEERTSQLVAMRGRSALDRLNGKVQETWDEISAEDKRSIIATFLPTIKVKRSTHYVNKFDPKRLVWGWRWPELAKAAMALPLDENDPVAVAQWEADQELETA